MTFSLEAIFTFFVLLWVFGLGLYVYLNVRTWGKTRGKTKAETKQEE